MTALLHAVAWAQAQTDAPVAKLAPVTVIGVSPLIGSGIDRDAVPAQTRVLTSTDISRDGTPDMTRALNQQVGGVVLDAAAGNPFQPTFFYHGFAASPLQGTPQGLAVYVNGMRFNQPFGDTVDWELIPDIAIDRLDVLGSNPVFGLNALGGALNLRLKDGFGYHGFEGDVSGGSFHHARGEFQFGSQNGSTAFYIAGDAVHQEGWRDLQSSAIQNLYGDFGWRGSSAEVHLNMTYAHSDLNGPGTSPIELLEVNRKAQFTAPNEIKNRYFATSLTGNFDLTDRSSVQALAYYRHFHQDVVNGNAPNDFPCDDPDLSGFLCSDDGVVSTTTGGEPIPDFLNGGPYSELDIQKTITKAYGASAQLTHTGDLFGLRNHFVVGASFDGARNDFTANSTLGGLTLDTREFIGPGVLLDEPGTNSPVSVAIDNSNYGVYFADTLNLTPQAALTLSGRYNDAQISLHDQLGGDLSGDHSYSHFNPAGGFTYRFSSALTAYAGYAVANRAPTPSELSCAGPENSCSLANFFVGDPHLDQVIAHTIEAGVRGSLAPFAGGALSYELGLFQTDLDNDIAFVNSVTQGRAYFANIGQTQRRGLDARVQLVTDRWNAYAAYSYIQARFRSSFVEGSGDNPAADEDGNITVQSGDRLPGIPEHQFKFGGYYKISDQWTVGLTGIASSGAYLFGDEANLTPRLPGYFVLNASTSYQFSKNVQLFAWVDNLTNQKYYTFGTFSPTTSVPLVEAPNATNPRSYSPAAPIGGFIGVRLTY
ncbi:MAG TPA: TonB-dependent receptor [Casimicrobiaceae bacterium]|nr:TonB-dependent receptor [Casimicrobiaceae bacterium]